MLEVEITVYEDADTPVIMMLCGVLWAMGVLPFLILSIVGIITWGWWVVGIATPILVGIPVYVYRKNYC